MNRKLWGHVVYLNTKGVKLGVKVSTCICFFWKLLVKCWNSLLQLAKKKMFIDCLQQILYTLYPCVFLLVVGRCGTTTHCRWGKMFLEFSASQNYLNFSKELFRDVIRLWQTPGPHIFFCPISEAYIIITGIRNFLSSMLRIHVIRWLKLPPSISPIILYVFVTWYEVRRQGC